MKKFTYSISLLILSAALHCHGQVLQNTDNPIFLPEKGDVSVGVDMVPILKIIFGTGETSDIVPSVNFKVMASDQVAVRTEIAVNRTSASAEDSDISQISSSYGVAIGPEWRTGNSRVQGYLGFMGAFLFSNYKIKDVKDDEPLGETPSYAGALKFFLGAECFVAPKFAIGSMVTWGPTYTTMTERYDGQDQGTISGFVISADNITGALTLSFYF